ncbi:hypothetical protein NZK35_18835 [Stieleria sp. ICT_E10.1]|uniref:hypothetical protein n=1 Tax=Stieleria sedimenti TaxID=2976331 RepID=UPI00217F5F7C|nr:hypothetical protein [Stieleria sedimenti]MCS7468714.1 hypothetical protein [Stieleria sedimenti]
MTGDSNSQSDWQTRDQEAGAVFLIGVITGLLLFSLFVDDRITSSWGDWLGQGSAMILGIVVAAAVLPLIVSRNGKSLTMAPYHMKGAVNGILLIASVLWRGSHVRPGVSYFTYQQYIRAESMSDRKTESASYKNRFARAFVGALGGTVIAEIARQMVQVDHVSLVRLVGLIVCSLVAGGMIGFEIANHRSGSASNGEPTD